MLATTTDPRTTPISSVVTAPLDPSQVDWLADYPPPRSLSLDRDALRIYEHAHYIGIRAEPSDNAPPISFSSVLAALLAGLDPTSQWFRGVAQTNGPNAVAVSAKTISQDIVSAMRPKPGKPTDIKVSTDKQLLTKSATAVLENAEGWARRVKANEIGVRHLVAAYVLNPP